MDAAVAAMKRDISALERMRSVTVVVLGGRVVTAYRDTALLRGRKSCRPGKHHGAEREEPGVRDLDIPDAVGG